MTTDLSSLPQPQQVLVQDLLRDLEREPQQRPRGTAVRLTELERALRATRGNMAAAARIVGRARQVVGERVQKSPRLQRVMEEIREETLDGCEGTVSGLALDERHLQAALAWLYAKGGEARGWRRPGTPGQTTVDVRVTLDLSGPAAGRLTDLAGADLEAELARRRAAVKPLLDQQPDGTLVPAKA